MHLSIISGSHRHHSESSRVARFLMQLLERNFPEVSCDLIDLAFSKLPLWDESFWSQKWPEWIPVEEILRKSDGLVVISPEWAGMVPSGLKNFFLLTSPKELADKPGLIVTVSAGQGGAYPVVELRTSSYKNNFLCYIPDQLIVRQVGSLLLQLDVDVSQEEQYLHERAHNNLALLVEYAKALKSVRQSKVRNLKKFPYGL